MEAPTDHWDDLRYFLAVARGGGLSSAARALVVNVSTVQRRVTALEQRLGTRLFDRTARGYHLTAAGHELLATVSRLDEELVSATRRLAGRDLDTVGAVRIATVDVFATHLLPPHLGRFHARYPRIDLELSVSPRLSSLSRREADVALRPGAAPTEANVVARRVGTSAAAVYCSRAYLAQHGKPRGRNPYEGHSLVTGDDSLGHVRFVRGLRERAHGATVTFRTDSVLAMARAAAAGFGLAALPCFFADRDPELLRVTEPDPELEVPLWLLVHSDLRHTARIRALADHLFDSLQADLPLLEGKAPARGARDG